MRNHVFKKLIHAILCISLIFLTGLLTSCSSDSSDSSPAASSETGEVVIGITDAAGDFASYTVDILSLTLTKANGAVVETLPLTTRVDFAQYVDMTELFLSATIPAGAYAEASMTLDFEHADIRVENEAGDAVPVAMIQDENGAPIKTLTVSVLLENNKNLIVAPGVPAHLVLDFDLSASNSVALNENGDPVLTVDPILVADITLKNSKLNRLRGPLQDVDTETRSFSVIIRPFAHKLSVRKPFFGALTVLTDDATTFNINGQIYQGDSGLSALAELPDYTAVVVIGNLKFNPCRFIAKEVSAGSAVPGGEQDTVTGNVIARTGNQFTVKGASINRGEGNAIFNDNVRIFLDDNTRVSRVFSTDEFTADDISIGQRVCFFGELTKNPDNQWELDATQGAAIMQLTTLKGTVVEIDPLSADETPLAIDLQSIDNRNTDIFDFDSISADPAHYEINTATLNISGLAAGAPVRVLGFVSPFGQAPPDFYAHTIVDVANVTSILKVHWNPPSNNAFEAISSDGLTLDLSGVGIFHHVNQGGVITDLSALSQSLVIVPPTGGSGVYVIHRKGPKALFSDFADFADELFILMEDNEVVKIDAVGVFDDDPATFESDEISVWLK